jgi:hypothetical protein
MTISSLIDNGICRLHLEAEERCTDMLCCLVHFLAPCFEPSTVAAPVHATIRITSYASTPDDILLNATHPVVFRCSACPEYNLSGFIGTLADGRVVAHDRQSSAAYEVDRSTRRILFYGAPDDPASAIHLHDFVRYLALLVCEARGNVLLHASAVTIDDRLVLVLGDKGAGKTTTMLNLIADQNARYYSGDKVVAGFAEGSLVLRAWPDIPYIGVGSLGQHPAIAAALGVALVDFDGVPIESRHKQLVDPFRFREVVPQSHLTRSDDVAAIILPDINASAEARWIPRTERRCEALAGIIEWPHEFLTAQWHQLYLGEARQGVADGGYAVLAALVERPWLKLNGRVAPPPIMEVCA